MGLQGDREEEAELQHREGEGEGEEHLGKKSTSNYIHG